MDNSEFQDNLVLLQTYLKKRMESSVMQNVLITGEEIRKVFKGKERELLHLGAALRLTVPNEHFSARQLQIVTLIVDKAILCLIQEMREHEM